MSATLSAILWVIEDDGVAAAGVDGDENVDERALVVGLDGGAWRAVFLQFSLNGGDAGGAAFGEVEFFLNSMRLDSIFCLFSKSVMLIGSAITLH